MLYQLNHSVCVSVFLASFPAYTLAVSDSFLAADADGAIFLVDAESYQSTQISQAAETFSFSEIEYTGNSTILYDSGVNIIRRDLISGQETNLYSTRTGFETGFFRSGGLALAADGDFLYNVIRFNANADIESHLVRVDSETQTATSVQMAPWIDPFDLHFINDNLILGALYQTDELVLINATTGAFQSRFSTNVGITSIFSVSDTLYGLGLYGDVFSIDLESQSLTLTGRLSQGGYFIGASGIPSGEIVIPSPSTTSIAGLCVLARCRRRR